MWDYEINVLGTCYKIKNGVYPSNRIKAENGGYTPRIISTVVDKKAGLNPLLGYTPRIISTVVDVEKTDLNPYGYTPRIISTVVDLLHSQMR